MRVVKTQVNEMGILKRKTGNSIYTTLSETKDRYKLLSNRYLHAVAKIEASLLKGARKYFEDHGFIEIITPHLTKATGACENIATMFELDYFGEKAYLSQTAQLYLEVLTPFLGKVWCIGPSFRAEPKADNRHLTEFTLIELEFKGGFNELLKHIEGVILSMIKCVLEERTNELKLLEINVERLEKISKPFKRMTYTEAIKQLSEFGLKWGDDLKSVHEKFLIETNGNQPLFITHYPKTIKFFNMKENEKNPLIVNSADLLLPFSGEAVGAAEREYEYEKLKKRLLNSTMLKQLIERGGSSKDFDWYLEFYKKHGTPHSGCGIGLSRVTQFVLGSDDIRATTVFPLNRESII